LLELKTILGRVIFLSFKVIQHLFFFFLIKFWVFRIFYF